MKNKQSLPLPAERLYRHCDPATLPFGDTTELEHLDNYYGQDRALDALRFGLGIRHEGYNIYVLGSSGMGKHEMLQDFLHQQTFDRPKPSDWCYVNNFGAPHQPKVLKLPCGLAQQLRKDMEQCVEDLLVTIPGVFQSAEYKARLNDITDAFNDQEQQAFSQLKEKAKARNIALLQTPTGYTLAPLLNDKIITSDEFEALNDDEKTVIEQNINELKEELKEVVQKMPMWVKSSREQFKKLNQAIVQNAVGQIFKELQNRYAEYADVIEFLALAKRDVIENVDAFREEEEHSSVPENLKTRVHEFPMYKVNVLVDNSGACTAPIVYENNPSLINLLGRVEHEAQYGTLTTDFTLIKGGALHRANGGYLLLDAIKVLTNPFAWDALKRALQSREARIESIDQLLSLVSTKSLEPEPVPLDIKVILLGDRTVYYLLQAYDPDFNLLFKVPADLSEELPRTDANTLGYARLIASLQHRKGIRPLNQSAVARVIEQGSRMLEDAEKLPLHLNLLTDLLCESDYFAEQANMEQIAAVHVQAAIDAASKRMDQFRERVQESILREIQLVDTRGEHIAQINGLSVYQLGEYVFGRPTRITAQARLGRGKVLDIEREVKLGGNIHSKAVLILSAFIANRYARNRPLPVSASLVFEQSYGGVEGDSASVAEITVLLSAIADIPIRQSLAVTGSINQHGQVQAIGGINQKIEGFYDICCARGLTGDQGVVMPAANTQHLMLEQRVIDAVSQGKFHIYAVSTIDEAVALLTGMSAGDADDQGEYPPDSVNGKVMSKIEAWIQTARKFSADNAQGNDHAE
ncbi:Lon protease family protein [Porticoccus sp.]|uniref:Lon protease family protein n=1 Tax=Porticoccus sp. TaxID=2024853 RepID=UPI003F6A0F5F